MSNPENELKESISRAQLVMKTPDSEPEPCATNKEASIVSSTICKFINRASGCKYGEKCRYSHESRSTKPARNGDLDATTQPVSKGEKFPGNSDSFTTRPEETFDSEKGKGAPTGSHDQKRDGAMPNKKRQIRRPVCRYFQKSGFCRDMDKCRFLHQANAIRSKKSFYNAPTESSKQTLSVARPIKRPENLSDKLSELTDEGVKYLQAVEIEQLKKRFGNSDLKIAQDDHGIVCMFTIKPTDPDWVSFVNQQSKKIGIKRLTQYI